MNSCVYLTDPAVEKLIIKMFRVLVFPPTITKSITITAKSTVMIIHVLVATLALITLTTPQITRCPVK